MSSCRRKLFFLIKKIFKRRFFVFFLCVFLGVILLYQNQISEHRFQTFYSSFVFSFNSLSKQSLETPFLQGNTVFTRSPVRLLQTQTLGLVFSNSSQNSIKEYIVKKGDNLNLIARRFGVSLETILWANNLTTKSVIREGQKLIILPVSGLLHQVKKGDTLSEIAKLYQTDIEKIIQVNNLDSADDIYIGDILIIPDGKMPARAVRQRNWHNPSKTLAKSYFICPHRNCYITQGLHWYNAIDFGGKCGDPIVAAAEGVVQKIKYGWNGGYGNYLTILHPNNVVTLYSHIQAALVVPGQKVSQGQTIALMGGKPGAPGAGRSTGCHVHFEVRGAKNPFAY